MKRIDTHNYEEFAIDYMVGNLSASEEKAFTTFLAEHPSIANEILLFETDAPIVMPEKRTFKNLKQDISAQGVTDDNFEEYCIASMEGDLDTEATLQLEKYIGTHKKRRAIMVQFEQTKLIPETLVYANKENLKKTVIIPFFSRRLVHISTLVAAASILTFGFFFSPKVENTPIEMAYNTPVINNSTPEVATKEVNTTAPRQVPKVLIAKAATLKETPKQTVIKNAISTTESNEGIRNTNDILEKLRAKKISIPENTIAMSTMTLVMSPTNKTVAVQAEEENSTLRSKTTKLLLSTVIAEGVKGINRMAETDLGYDVIEDKEGNPIRVIIKSRFGEIDRTLAQR